MGTLNTILAIVPTSITIIGLIFGAYKWILNQTAHDKEQDERIDKFKTSVNEQMEAVKDENQIICHALLACLDGLKQLGANGNVTKEYNELESYLINKAHK